MRQTVGDSKPCDRADRESRVSSRIRGAVARVATALTICATLAAVGAPMSRADFGFVSAGSALRGVGGGPSRQAGGHADLETKMVFKTYVNPVSGEIEPDGSVRNVRVDLPAGMVGIPTVAAECTLEQLLASSCPLDSQVGTLVAIDTNEGGLAPAGLFNMVPRPNAPAEFAYSYAGALVTIVPEVRPGDYGISSLSARTTQIENIYGVDVTLWGVPAAHSHDGERAGASPKARFPPRRPRARLCGRRPHAPRVRKTH